MLEVVGAVIDAELIAAWRARVERAGAHLGWGDRVSVARRHRGGASLAIAAPLDQLLLATEVNEWALCATLVARDPIRWSALEAALIDAAGPPPAPAPPPPPPPPPPPILEEAAAFARFAILSSREANPGLHALLDAAATRRLSHVVDDAILTLGAGAGGRDFLLVDLPDVERVEWGLLHDIPTAIVTGSNGKTTTVRLLAACARAHGWHAGYNCTDGVFLDDEALARGDYSGPDGARWVMRERRTQAAILETARGGILRRGIAVSRARTAIITNVSPDHFGEYGIDDLAGVAAVKFAVAAVIAADGLLVLNADDSQLREQVDRLPRSTRSPTGWFSANPDPAVLREYQTAGAATCGVREERLYLTLGPVEQDLGPIRAMPLAMGGSAAYNIANMAGAALAAMALGICATTIAAVFARFGADPRDNPGRMMRFEMNGADVLLDYAHNADGLRGFLKVATHLRGTGRLGLLLGQAGNRRDCDIEELARVVAEFRPDLVVVKENETQLRGRAPGEVPRIIRAELRRLGLPESALPLANSEVEAARVALEWARPGDVLALPVHSSSARAAVLEMLEKPHR